MGLDGAAQIAQRNTSLPAVSSPASAALTDIEKDLGAGRFRQAQAKAQEVLKTQSDNALAWTYLGMASVRLKQPQQAIQAFERSIAIDPRDPRPYMDVALLYASTNDLDKAIDRYQKGLSLDGRYGAAYYNYGRLLITRGRYKEAADALKHAVQINPADTEARTGLVEAFLRGQQRQEAADQVRVFLESSQVPLPALVSLGALLVGGGELELAKAVLTRALSISPNSPGAHLELSKFYLALHDGHNAVRAAQRAAELAPASLEANLALAEALISERQDFEALNLLLRKRQQFAKSAAFQYTLGIAQYRTKHFQPAISAFKKAVQIDPTLDLAHFLLGDAFFNAGDLDHAEAGFKAAIAQNPKNVLYYNFLARVYEKKGNQFHEPALEITEKALALDPKDIESRERLAKWARKEGDLPRARALLEQIVTEDPARISARVLLASVYYRLNLRHEGDEQQKMIRSLEAEAQQHQSSPN